ncbi:hypothetical protein BAMBUS_05210 [Brevundimonas phage vB_BpoS-Bambus]|nr:hypothetical protein BAMBUS_05210 [Brevundimonas phage vB_BpoS-Bambus]
MGLAITIGVVIALTIALILWARGAVSAANRRYEAQVRSNEAAKRAASAARARSFASRATLDKHPVETSRYTPYQPYAKRAAPTSHIVDFGYVDYGSSSDSHHSGGSCSSGGGDGGGGCD